MAMNSSDLRKRTAMHGSLKLLHELWYIVCLVLSCVVWTIWSSKHFNSIIILEMHIILNHSSPVIKLSAVLLNQEPID